MLIVGVVCAVLGILTGVVVTALVCAGKRSDEQMEGWFHDDG